MVALSRQAYSYAGDNPLTNVDPSGLNFCSAGNALAGDQSDCNPSPTTPPDQVSAGVVQCNGNPNDDGTICYQSNGHEWIQTKADTRALFPLDDGDDVSVRDIPAVAGPTVLIAFGLATLPHALVEEALGVLIGLPPAFSLAIGIKTLQSAWARGGCK